MAKCVQNKNELNDIFRVSDEQAKKMVATGQFQYVPKDLWKKVKRDKTHEIRQSIAGVVLYSFAIEQELLSNEDNRIESLAIGYSVEDVNNTAVALSRVDRTLNHDEDEKPLGHVKSITTELDGSLNIVVEDLKDGQNS